jgi:hypothetical protein
MTLDMLQDVSKRFSDIQIALLVDNATEHILRACTFETSLDGFGWVSPSQLLVFVCLKGPRLLLSGNLPAFRSTLRG